MARQPRRETPAGKNLIFEFHYDSEIQWFEARLSLPINRAIVAVQDLMTILTSKVPPKV